MMLRNLWCEYLGLDVQFAVVIHSGHTLCHFTAKPPDVEFGLKILSKQ